MSSVSSPPAVAPIPFLDLVSPHRLLEEDLVASFRRALGGARFINGPEVTGFEAEFAAWVGTSGCVGLASGTDALRLGFQALGLKPGDEVITVSHTFIATSESITQAGGTIRFVDIDEATMTMDPAALEAAITPMTVGIVPVHLYGHPADMDPILAVAKKHGLWVVEDACQAHGAAYRGRACGTMGRFSAFSFYPGKNLGALGDAGSLNSNDAELLAAVRRLREHGQNQKYYHESEGWTARLDAIQAGFLRIKLPHLAAWNDARRDAASWYREALADVPDIVLPVEAEQSRHVYHLYVIRGPKREQLQAQLEKARIGTGLHYPLPLHLQAAYAAMGLRRGSLPVTERTAERVLSLPMYPGLTRQDVARVADAIRGFFR